MQAILIVILSILSLTVTAQSSATFDTNGRQNGWSNASIVAKKVVTADYTTLASDNTILVNNGTTPITITLGNFEGQVITIGRINSSSSGVITLATTVGGNIANENGAIVSTTTILTTTNQRFHTYMINSGFWIRIR
jgi:hypothetical protein